MFGKKKDSILIGKGYRLDDRDCKLRNIWLKDQHRKAHLFCFGSTRIGKTKLIINMIRQDIQKGHSVVMIDPKGDHDLLSSIIMFAFKEKREDELILITPIYPEFSARIDPLSYYYMSEEVVSHVVSGIRAREEFFVNIAYETTLIIVQTLIIFQKLGIENSVHINFDAIKRRCSFSGLQELRVGLHDINSEEAEEIRKSLDDILSSPQDYFAKISSSLRTVLTSLSTGSVGQIIGKAQNNEFIKRLEQGKRVILIIQTGSLLTRRTSHIVSRVLVSMIQSFVGRRYAAGKTVSPPLSVYIDEFSNVAYLDIADLFSKSSGADVWIHAFTQSIADLNAEIGDNPARKILDNCNTKIFMRVNDPKTAEYIADYSGRTQVFSPLLHLGGGITAREVEEPTILPEDVMGLSPRDFFMFSFEGGFKGRTLIVHPPGITIEFPQLSIEKN
jgi:conjugal transfer pilus assembly protein TraD